MAANYEYLIETIFRERGITPTAKKIKEIDRAFTKIGESGKKNVQQMGDFEKALRRVAIVVPIWALARAAIQAITAPIKEVTKALLELDTGLSKVATVSRVSLGEQKQFFTDLTAAAFNYYRTSSASMKDITESMYQIGTAGRSTTEILKGFNHVLDLSIATFGNVTDAGRTLTGVLNVYGASLTNQITATEKMKYIADLLTYTWSNNQVELNEIALAIGYAGAAANSLDIDLKTLVGTIGFLNTGLLRGSKAGTSLLNAFIQIATSTEKLRNLGIVFDPRKPLDFLDVMTQLRARFEETGKSLAFTEELFDVFGKRGGRAISIIINDWDSWIERIKTADSEFKDFAESTRQTAEKTLPKAFGKFFKLRFIPADIKTGLNPLTEFFNNLNKQIIQNQEDLRDYYDLIEEGYDLPPVKIVPTPGVIGGFKFIAPELDKMTEKALEFKRLIDWKGSLEEANKELEKSAKQIQTDADLAKIFLDASIDLGHSWKDLDEETKNMIFNYAGINRENEKQVKELEKIYNYRFKIAQQARAEEKATNNISLGLVKKLEQNDLETKYALMKVKGAEDEEIAYIKLVDRVRELNRLAEQDNERRREAGKTLYQTLNLTDVLRGNWSKIFQSGSLILDKEKDVLAIEKLRTQIITAQNQKYQDQVDTLKSLALEYEQADMFEKGRLRRVAELAAMTPERLKQVFESSTYDKNLIIEYWNTFSQEARDALIETTTLYKDFINKLPKETLTNILSVRQPRFEPFRAPEALKAPVTNNITNKGAEIINIAVHAPGATSEEIARITSEYIKRELLANDDFQSIFARKITPKMEVR